MHPNEQFRKAVRGFYAWLGVFLLAALSPLAASRLIESPSTTWRIAGVVLGVGAWIPLMFVVARIIREGDEFARRIHLTALAIAFACGLVLVSLLDWLVRAEFMQPPPLMMVWLLIALSWAVALLAVKRHYERPQ